MFFFFRAQVPSSYVALQQKVAEEVMRCREKEVPPVLNQKEFAALAESIEDGDINDPEELSLGMCACTCTIYYVLLLYIVGSL